MESDVDIVSMIVALKKIKTLNLIVDDHGNFVKGLRLDAILNPRVEQPHVGNDLVEKQREIEDVEGSAKEA